VVRGARVPGDPVSYRLTPDGEVEFRRLLVTALREPEPGDASRLLGGLCFMTALSRADVREALRARGLVLEAMTSSAAATVRSVEESRLAPASTVELSRVVGHWLEGERTWVQEVRAARRRPLPVRRGPGRPGPPDAGSLAARRPGKPLTAS
jgi:hypothetical protein